MMIPGEYILKKENIELNAGKAVVRLPVKNVGDRAVQVGSHFHFFEVNRHLKFDREAAYGFSLDIASGTAVRFEPGEEKEVQLVELGGVKRVIGLNGLTNGQTNELNKKQAIENAKSKSFID